ncbi:MAG: hypothetical protein AB8F95_22550 [Bacteroidia bacterium]
MKTILAIFWMALLTLSCNAQNSVTTNEIIKTSDNLFGVKSADGSLLIDTLYGRISIVYAGARLTLPTAKREVNPKPLEYYVVSNKAHQKALFNSDGKVVFDFVDCHSIQFDQHTQSIVTTELTASNSLRGKLYDISGQAVFDTTFESVAFINNSDLIALIAQDGSIDEYYLYNPFTKKRMGPFDHFNIYNKDSGPPLGMKKEDFVKYTSLDVIAVRKTVDRDYVWGIVDMKGDEILPIEYDYFRLVGNDMKGTYLKNAEKPEDVEFLFYSRKSGSTYNMLFLDADMQVYEFKREDGQKGVIRKVE